eukprot:jgi/Chrzof1/15239/Cz09g32180.t1
MHRSTSNIARHLHDHHNPRGTGPEERTGVFALCIVRRPSDGKFLMTQEFAGSGFWVPGGGVDKGESLTAAAIRETLEEAGVDVQLRGVLQVEDKHTWRRIIFYGEPGEGAAQQPKTIPDFESAGACWVNVADLQHIPLRNASEPCTWFPYVACGGKIASMPADVDNKFNNPGHWPC